MQSILYHMISGTYEVIPKSFDLLNIIIGIFLIALGYLLHMRNKKVQWPYIFVGVGIVSVIVNTLKVFSVI